jgi:hypothetical protein
MIVDSISKEMLDELDIGYIMETVKKLSSSRYGVFSDNFLNKTIPIEFADSYYTGSHGRSSVKMYIRFAIPEDKYISKNDLNILRWWNFNEDDYSFDGISVQLTAGKIVVPVILSEDEIIDLYVAKYGCDDIDEMLEEEERYYDKIINGTANVPTFHKHKEEQESKSYH